ncbi:thiosulfate sulfurtransferase [Halolactibacillus alkaliphilus]|uniref:Thiosulfate sulfurtransferase n=1 Tax=Halolactibacillus alkaliphilus TaxID=442899 RepID=A0A511X3H7_9BACI|nr:sulfurtransferase [Halolactibacillus alkaliphilus]GEN57493.1 thiosulfate sulfurtransferase [Halolactibacillus alkaliphilus]GGN74083.1 thiosulfate sulfurtransferase [Halolactibacillus alkaliphilus]SFO99977.1 thiosulfate/3-mercaptopyruvate sulfurtransferase [Halolactibacillus alkaliphilus]
MTFLIEPETLLKSIDEYTIIDTRFELLDPSKGRELFQTSHIPGAVYFDLNKDLSGVQKKHGGNHPLPDEVVFIEKLRQIGVANDTKVVIYDQGNAMFAARLYWLFDHYQHPTVYVLNGGFDRWEKLNYPVTNVVRRKEKSTTPFVRNNELVVDIDYVIEHKDDFNITLTDARSLERYLGLTEPLYHKKGHIPGAKCYDWQQVLNEDGTWKTKSELESVFKDLSKEDEIILSCGSGVSACMNYLALKFLGYKNVKLYPGSFSDWISYPELPVEKE